MGLGSLINEVLAEGDEVWVETDEGRVEGIFDHHVISGNSIELYFKEDQSQERNFYTVSGSNLHSGNNFGLVGGEEGIYDIIQDYGMDGEKLDSRIEEAVNDSYALELYELTEKYEKDLAMAD